MAARLVSWRTARLVSWRTGWPVSWRTGWPVSWRTGWPVSWRTGWPVSWRTGWLVSWRTGRLWSWRTAVLTGLALCWMVYTLVTSRTPPHSTTVTDAAPCSSLVVSHWLPHAFLWCCLLAEIPYITLTDRRNRNRLYYRLYRMKTVLGSLALLAYLAELLSDLGTVDTSSPWPASLAALLNAASLACACLVAAVEVWRGMHPTFVPCGFWLLLLAAENSLLRAVLLQVNHQQEMSCDSSVFRLIRLSTLVAVSAWSVVTDVLMPSRLFMSHPLGKGLNGHDTTNLLSRVTFAWMIRPELVALRRQISLSDLFVYTPGEGCKDSLSKVDIYTARRPRIEEGARLQPASGGSLIVGVLRQVLPSVFLPLLARCIAMMVKVTQLFILRDLLVYLEGGEEGGGLRPGLYLAGRLAVTNLVQCLAPSHYFYSTHYASTKLRGILSVLVMRKFLSLPAAGRHTSTADVISYMAVDVQKVAAVLAESNSGFELLILGPAAVYVLWASFGASCLVGVLVFCLVIFVNSVPLRAAMHRIKAAELVAKVKRIGLIQSILTGIKVLKFNAWEDIYEEKISKTRDKELQYIRKSLYIQAASNTLSLLAPYLVITAVLVIYVFLSPSHPISAEKIFVTMAAVDNTLIFVVYLPIAATYIAQGYVSGCRLMTFLHTGEQGTPHDVTPTGYTKDTGVSNHDVTTTRCTKNPGVRTSYIALAVTEQGADTTDEPHNHQVSRPSPDGGRVCLTQASFTWNNKNLDTATLQSIDLQVGCGQCVAVVGSVGAGKSSLLSAILGEMTQLAGQRTVTGSIGYVPQEPWILQATVKDNITFGCETSMHQIQKVVQACALDKDLSALKDGIYTELGERGITLSGGQRQRLSLARAVYADADIYLLDDPLSAVDTKVAKHLYEEVIGPQGLLCNKTRILVTHALQWLPLVDVVVVIEDGHVVASGTFDELMSHDSLLSNHMKWYNKHEDSDKLPEGSERNASLYHIEQSFTAPSVMTKELRDQSTTSLQTLLTYTRSMGPGRAAAILVLFLLLTLTTSMSNIWVTWWSADWKKDPARADLNTHFRLGIHVALGALHLTLTLLGLIFMAHSSLTSARNLHRDLLSRVLRATLTFFDTTPVGRIVNWFTKDTDDIDISLPKEMWFQLYSVPPILSMMAITTYVVPATLLLNIPMLACFVAIQRLYTTYVRQVMRIDGMAKSPVFSFFDETVRGAVSIRAYRKQNYFCDIFYDLVDDSTRPMWHLAAAKVLMITAISCVSTAMCLCVSVVCVVYRDQLDPALSAVALFCTMQGMFTLQSFIRHTAELERALVAVERITGHNHLTKEGAWRTPGGASADSNWPLGGSIRFEAYSTTYRADLEPALKDLTFGIQASEKVGIVGRTGAGKTTLTLALLRMLEPQHGHIYIDDVDITKLGLHHLRSNVTVITQDPVLFEGTIRDNLDPAGCHDDAALWEALEHAHLKDFIMAAPGGLNWYCRDAGQLLSVGQRQLVCLARALLRRSRVLVLDEPTASVDVTTDSLVQDTLRQHLHHCTLLTIAHRLRTVMASDRVLLMEAGRVAEFDTPHNLLQDTSSRFYSLAMEAGLVC